MSAFVYSWSHDLAAAATVQRAVERFGWSWRGAIYVNYAFLAVWLAYPSGLATSANSAL